MATIRILHASDLHLAKNSRQRSPVDKFSDLSGEDLGFLNLSKLAFETFKALLLKAAASSYDPELLKSLAWFVYENARRKFSATRVLVEDDGPEKIDAVILTGDLATTGDAKDIGKVKDFLTAPFDSRYIYLSAAKQATLTASQIPVWYLPGNHDRFVATLDFEFVHNLAFPRIFNPGGHNFDVQLQNFQAEPVRVLGYLKEPLTKNSSLCVIVLAADFSLKRFEDHEGLYGWLAQGKVDLEDILPRLVKKTNEEIAKHKASGAGVICPLWAIHFPPGFPHIKKGSRLIGQKELIQAAKGCGVKAVLAGHTHEQTSYRKPGMNFDVLCCGTTTQYEPLSRGNRFQIINITAEPAQGVQIALQSYKYKRVGEDGVSEAGFYEET